MPESTFNTLRVDRGSFTLNVPEQHPSYAGHFPNFPIVPGVLCLALVFPAVFRELDLDVQLEQLKTVKFMAPIYPGDQLSIEYLIQESKLTVDITKNALKTVAVVAVVTGQVV
jgi:3-hydroxyacyl-[acyl-carrier-protein] dehydratase